MAEFTLASFAVGQRVELSPATDRWMSGDRFGTVEGVGRKLLRIKMDRSGQTAKVSPVNIYAIMSS